MSTSRSDGRERVGHRILPALSASHQTDLARPSSHDGGAASIVRRQRHDDLGDRGCDREGVDTCARGSSGRRPPATASAPDAPSRVPLPPAAMIAVTCMGDGICRRVKRLIISATARQRSQSLTFGTLTTLDVARRPRGPVRELAPSPANACRRNRLVDRDRHVAGARHQPALEHHVPAAGDADRHDRQPRVDRHEEHAALEARDRAIHAARALGKHDERPRAADQPRHLLDDAGARILAIDQQMPGPPQVPAEKRETPERLLGDDPQLQRHRRRRRSGCRRCSDGSTRTRSCVRARAARRRAPVTSTPVVLRTSHAQARAHLWPKSPLESTSDESIEIVPRTIV